MAKLPCEVSSKIKGASKEELESWYLDVRVTRDDYERWRASSETDESVEALAYITSLECYTSALESRLKLFVRRLRRSKKVERVTPHDG